KRSARLPRQIRRRHDSYARRRWRQRQTHCPLPPPRHEKANGKIRQPPADLIPSIFKLPSLVQRSFHRHRKKRVPELRRMDSVPKQCVVGIAAHTLSDRVHARRSDVRESKMRCIRLNRIEQRKNPQAPDPDPLQKSLQGQQLVEVLVRRYRSRRGKGRIALRRRQHTDVDYVGDQKIPCTRPAQQQLSLRDSRCYLKSKLLRGNSSRKASDDV